MTVLLTYPFLSTEAQHIRRQRWSARLLECLGIRLVAEGEPIAPGSLLVANHISWVDVFVINALHPSAFIAKSEVRAWPLIGWLAARNGTIFLRRGSRGHARIINEEIARALDRGANVALFPEGTTTDGTHLLHFHAALLQPALSAGHAIQPLALRYHDTHGRYCAAPAYVGEMSLGQSLAHILATRQIIARVDIAAPLAADSGDRRELAQRARETIASRIAPKTPSLPFPEGLRAPPGTLLRPPA